MGLHTKTDWLTDCRSYRDFDYGSVIVSRQLKTTFETVESRQRSKQKTILGAVTKQRPATEIYRVQ
jgi:hypothetical protein